MVSSSTIKSVIFTIALSVLTSACSPKAAFDVELGTKSASIIGGVQVAKEDAIAQSTVAIVVIAKNQQDQDVQFICTGSLLEKNIILTAAHCLPNSDLKEAHMLVAFQTDLKKLTQADIYPVIDFAIHPSYGKVDEMGRGARDIALIKILGEAPKGYVPAKFLEDESILKRGTVVTLAGYGLNKTDGVNTESDDTLRKTDVLVYDEFGPTELVLDQTQGKGACHGDSGGPALVEVAGVQYVWGVTSRGIGQNGVDDCSLVSIYTKVKAESEFITEALAKLKK